MWDAIVQLSENKFIIILIAALIALAIFLIKKGWFRLNTGSVTIGEQVSRELIRNQWEYAASSCEAQYSKIRPYCKSDEEAKSGLMNGFGLDDVFQSAIVYNYMSENESYVKAKQALVLNAIQKRTSDKHFYTDEFRACCNRFVDNLIRDLVRMKRIGK